VTFRSVHRSALCIALLLPTLALTACASSRGADDSAAGGRMLELVIRDGHLRELGASCSGARPYLEFHKGAELALLDEDGHAAFATVLEDGEAVKVDDIDYGEAPRIPTFCRFPLGAAALENGVTYQVSIDDHVVAEHRADAAATMVFIPALVSVDPIIEGTE
jgi:hypothetical protein